MYVKFRYKIQTSWLRGNLRRSS